MTLGDIIKSYRKEHSLSMDSFSKLSGISKAYIGLLEKNKHPKTGKQITPSIRFIKQAAKAMGMEFDALFAMIDGDVSLDDDVALDNTSLTSGFSGSEVILIEKYRTLDAYGKRNVDTLLDNEYARCNYYIETLAAHVNDGATEEEKQSDYDILKQRLKERNE